MRTKPGRRFGALSPKGTRLRPTEGCVAQVQETPD
jgi:hypothetical protein